MAWCILNRVDSGAYSDSIMEVVTQYRQFHGYDEENPVDEHIKDLVLDVFGRWATEKRGQEDVGRTLPAEYLFFWGDGLYNHFTDEYLGGEEWDWSLPEPLRDLRGDPEWTKRFWRQGSRRNGPSGFAIDDDVAEEVLAYAKRKCELNHKPDDYLLLLYEDELADYFMRLQINLRGRNELCAAFACVVPATHDVLMHQTRLRFTPANIAVSLSSRGSVLGAGRRLLPHG